MIPILFEKNTVDFSTLGLGALSDCVTATCKRALNGMDEIAITYPDNGIRVNDLQHSRIIFAQPEYKKDAQPYEIYEITKPVKGLISIYARHIRGRASYIPVMPFSASSLAETLAKIPDYCAEENPFTFWTDKSVTANFRLSTPASLGNVLGGMEGSILDVYGGEYEFDMFTIKLWNRRGVDRGVTLRYGKNITDATQEESIDSTITGICPFWDDGEGHLVTLPEKVVHSSNASNFPFNRTIPYDFSERFDDQPTEAQLRAAATAYISKSGIGVPKVSLTVSFEHLAQYAEYKDRAILETVNLGDTVRVIFERLDVDSSARIVQTEYDILNEKYKKVSIGNVRANLGTAIKEAVEDAKDQSIGQMKSNLEKAIDQATQMLTGANGGYLVDIFDANNQRTGDMIMNTNDPSTATNIWLRNLNGWGFSGNGINGQFRTAITQDGHIVADFIDTGVLTANIIRAGTLTSSRNTANYWNLDTGELRISAITNANLLPSIYYREDKNGADQPYVFNGVTWTLNEDGSVTATGKAVGGGSSYSFCGGVLTAKIPPVKLDPTKKYTVSGCPSGSENGTKFRINARFYPQGVDPDGTNNGTNYQDNGSGVTAPIGNWYVMIYATVYENTQLPSDGITFYPMLNVGERAQPYVSTHDRLGLLYDRITSAEASISVNERNIELKVSEEDFTGENIVSLINLSPDSAIIKAKHISLAGKTIDLSADTISITSTNFIVSDDGEITAKSGNIAGWKINDTWFGKEGTLNGTPYLAYMQAPTTPTQNSAFLCLRTGESGSYSYPFIVRYDGSVKVTDGTFTGKITGSTITSTTTKEYSKSDYSLAEINSISALILTGRYPTAAQLDKYDLNRDGMIDVYDLAIARGMIDNDQNYTTKTVTTISPTDSVNPVKITYGGASGDASISMKNGTLIGANRVQSGSFLVMDKNNVVRATLTTADDFLGLNLYDSSRYVKTSLTDSALRFLNTSGTKLMSLETSGLKYYNSSGAVTGEYSNYRASGEIYSWTVNANSTASQTISFGKTFPTAPYVWVQLTQSSANAFYGGVSLAVTSTTTTGFTVRAFNNTSSNAGVPFRWMTF